MSVLSLHYPPLHILCTVSSAFQNNRLEKGFTDTYIVMSKICNVTIQSTSTKPVVLPQY